MKAPWEMTAEEIYNTMPIKVFDEYAEKANPDKYKWYEARRFMNAKVRITDLHRDIVMMFGK